MKIVRKLLIPSFFLTTVLSTAAYADIDVLATYLQNFGLYFGFDLTKAPPTSSNPSQGTPTTVMDLNAILYPEQLAFKTMLGAMPANTATISPPFNFVPSDSPDSSVNNYVNITFKTPPYNAASNGGSQSQQGITANPGIDQKTYEGDPVSQAILNILTTPDYTYCTNSDNTLWINGCPALTQIGKQMTTPLMSDIEVTQKVIGNIPDPMTYISNSYNQPLIGQLNSNTLLSPLLYSIATNNQSSNSVGSSGNAQPNSANGLTANSQAEEAANFIRYATGEVTPLALPNLSDYSQLYSKVITTSKDNSISVDQMTAVSKLSTYLANLRVYAAQTSVGISNLYYIFSKRMPQTLTNSDGTSSKNTTSQALSEFNMATWRLFNSNGKSPWLAQINQASSATVEKEMVTLLAEINYQLYLNRQQEERLLLTNSLLLIQNARSSQPTASQLSPANASDKNS